MAEAPLITSHRQEAPFHSGHRIASDPFGGEWCQDCDKFIGFPPISDPTPDSARFRGNAK